MSYDWMDNIDYGGTDGYTGDANAGDNIDAGGGWNPGAGSGSSGINWAAILGTGARYALPIYGAYQKYQTAQDAIDAANAGEGSGGSSSYSGLSAEARAMRDRAYAALGGVFDSKDYSKEAAIKDSQAGIKQIFEDFKVNELSKIFADGVTTGGYNSPTRRMLGEYAQGQAAGRGLAFQTEVINSYAKNRQSELNTLLNLVMSDRESSSSGGGRSSGGASSTQQAAADAARLQLLTGLLGAGGAIADSAGAFSATKPADA